MKQSSILQAESCILQLQSSINDTSRNIQKSKQVLYSLQQSYFSSAQREESTFKVPQTQSLHLNINMSIQDQQFNRSKETPQVEELRFNGEKYIREKKFVRIGEEEGSQGGRRRDLLKEGSIKESKYLVMDDGEKEMGFLLEGNERIGSEKEIYCVKVSKRDGVTAGRNYNSITVQTDPIDPLPPSRQPEPSQVNYQTPLRKTVLDAYQSTQAVYSRMSNKRSESRKPIFSKKHYHSTERELQNYEERFQSIKEKLRMAESMIEQNVEARKRKEKMQSARSNDNRVASKTKSVRISTQPHQHHLTKTTHNNSPHRHNCSKHQSQSKSQSPSKREPKKNRMIDQFSKSSHYIRTNGFVKCDKYKREIQKDTRERYLSEAMKTPGIEKYFTYSELYHFYIDFRKMDMPEFKWVDYLQHKLKSMVKQKATQNPEILRD